MKLKLDNIENKTFWESHEVDLPTFNVKEMVEKTKKTPQWVHIGAGNIFRGFIARAHQELLNKELYETGITVVESFDFEVIEKVYHPYDNLSLLLKHYQ